MANVTTTTAANFIPEIWSAKTKDATQSKLHMRNHVLTDYEGDIRQAGDTVRITEISNLSTGSKAASTAVTFEAITESQQTIAINNHKYAAIRVEDIVKIQSNVDLLSKYTQKMGYALAKDIDTALLGLYTGLSQSVGTANTAPTNANFLAAIQFLDVADAPEEDRAAVFHAQEKANLLNIDNFVRYDSHGIGGQSNPVITGEFGEIYGIPVMFSSNVTQTGSPTNTHNLVFHKEAFALALQNDVRVQTDYNLEQLAHEVVADVLYGVAEYRDTFGVRFLT